MEQREQLEKMLSHRNAFLDVAEVEEDLGLGSGTVRTWISRGLCPIPFVRIRSRVRIRKDALIDWLMDQEMTQTEENPASAVVPVDVRRKRGRPPKVCDLQKEAAYEQR